MLRPALNSAAGARRGAVERPRPRFVETARLCQYSESGLAGRATIRHEVHPIARTGLAGPARFPPRRPRRRVPALRGCRRADRPRIPAGPRRHRSRSGDPGAAFFCSNRHSKLGCGRTFPVYRSEVIPYCSLRTRQLFELLSLVSRRASGTSVHAAWRASRLVFSQRTARRWLARWSDLTTHVRAGLGLVAAPPGRTDGRADPMTLRHLVAAFPGAACPIAAFQERLQTAVTGAAG